MSTSSHDAEAVTVLESHTMKPVPMWKKVLAAVLDFLTIFFAGGFVIGMLTGQRTAEGFSLEGIPALILFALIAIYFVVGSKYLGGTLWQRILGTRAESVSD